MRKNIYPFLLLALLLASCSKGAQQRQRLIPVQGSNNLSSSEFADFAAIIASDVAKTTTLFPTDNSQFNRIVHYKKAQSNQYTIKVKGKKYICNYSYLQATEETSFTKEVITNDQGKDVVQYKYQTTTIPINPTYTTVPNIAEIKVACDAQISPLNKVGQETIIDFEASWKDFQALMTEQFVQTVSACSRSALIDGHRCVGVNFSRSLKSDGNPVTTYAFTMDFTWEDANAVQSHTTVAIEIAPSLYYLETYGVLNLEKGLPLSSSTVDLSVSDIQSLKLDGF